MKLVQILLPLRDNRGRPFKRSLHERLRKEITDEFGGLTAIPGRRRAASGSQPEKQSVTIWWCSKSCPPRTAHLVEALRNKLERRFRQEKLIIRMQDMALV